MWVLIQYSQGNIRMYEFDNVEEARDKYNTTEGCRILSEVIYYNDVEELKFV